MLIENSSVVLVVASDVKVKNWFKGTGWEKFSNGKSCLYDKDALYTIRVARIRLLSECKAKSSLAAIPYHTCLEMWFLWGKCSTATAIFLALGGNIANSLKRQIMEMGHGLRVVKKWVLFATADWVPCCSVSSISILISKFGCLEVLKSLYLEGEWLRFEMASFTTNTEVVLGENGE